MSRPRRLGMGLACLLCLGLVPSAIGATSIRTDPVIIEADQPLNTITPDVALGAAIDGMGRGGVESDLQPFNLAKMRTAGLPSITYRTRPELGIEAWHWSEEGQWSDPAHGQGYWTSSDNPSRHPTVTWGYSLPRRGDSIDQANDLGYSRLDDGDPKTFWKSNPYLDPRYTGAIDPRPQWIVVSLDKPTPVDAVRLQWVEPFARRFRVQYWQGRDQHDKSGHWTTFPQGEKTADRPDDRVLRVADAPLSVQFVRVLLLESSQTAPPGSTDIRDRLGFAMSEIGVGLARADGGLDDAVVHGTSRDGQTNIQVSSTDPWHRASDRDPETEQPSLDRIFDIGLNNGSPIMIPVGVYYDTPENAVAEIRYLKRRGYPMRQVELGEEADGQFIAPEDYADLYLETARALHAIAPDLSLGGPSMQGAMTDTWPDPEDGWLWTQRFVARLSKRGGLGELGFFSFEHYAFDDVCGPIGPLLRDDTVKLKGMMDATAQAGMPRSIPWIISEYGFSPFSGRAMSEIPSALLSADIVGNFLSQGGARAFMLGYTASEPANQIFPCAGYGDMMLFQADGHGRARWPMPMYYATRMMMEDWGGPADRPHELYAAHSTVNDAQGRPMVTVYPLRAPNGEWAVMLINRDSERAYSAPIAFRAKGQDRVWGRAGLSVTQYSGADYTWIDKGEASHPGKDLPPERFSLGGGQAVTLPPFSLTVVRGAAD